LLSGLSSSIRTYQFYEDTDKSSLGRPYLEFVTHGQRFPHRTHLPGTLFEEFVVQLGAGASPSRWRARREIPGNGLYQLVEGSSLSFTEGGIYEFHMLDVTPKSVTVESDSGRLNVSWTNPSTPGSYRLRYKISSDSNWTTHPGSVTSPREITGLSNETPYSVEVGTTVTGIDDHVFWANAVEATPTAKSLMLSTSSLAVDEDGGSASWAVQLSEAPSAEVSVALAVSPAAATLSPASLIFTASDWDSVQTVTARGVDDDLDNPGKRRDAIVTHSVTSSDSGYSGRSAELPLVVIDDEIEAEPDALLSTVLFAGSKDGSAGYSSLPGNAFGVITDTALHGIGNGFSLRDVYDPAGSYRALLEFLDSSGSPALLPSPLDEQFVVQSGSGDSASFWRARREGSYSRYRLVSGTVPHFVADALYELHLFNATPTDVAAVPSGSNSLTVSWTEIPFASPDIA